ncbi:hypothetical protein FDK38_004092 [Candidozyma auris]|nr:hypothetical protein FDK38_004092 [[Candida] auris]
MAAMSEPHEWELSRFADVTDDDNTLLSDPSVPRPQSLLASLTPPPDPSLDASDDDNLPSETAAVAASETASNPSLALVATTTAVEDDPIASSHSSHQQVPFTLPEFGNFDENYLHGRHARPLTDLSVQSPSLGSNQSPHMLEYHLPRRGRPPSTSLGSALHLSASALRHRVARQTARTTSKDQSPGTFFVYKTMNDIWNDQPRIQGHLDLSNYVKPGVGRKTHREVVRSVELEFKLQDEYNRRYAGYRFPKTKKRQHDDDDEFERTRSFPAIGGGWKPNSIHATYSDSKPPYYKFFGYIDNVPKESCFGRINFRLRKAWNRGPNRKKPRRASDEDSTREETSPDGSSRSSQEDPDYRPPRQFQEQYQPQEGSSRSHHQHQHHQHHQYPQLYQPQHHYSHYQHQQHQPLVFESTVHFNQTHLQAQQASAQAKLQQARIEAQDVLMYPEDRYSERQYGHYSY